MHGYGYPPERPPKRRPSSATLNSLRVLFVSMTVLSCGLLAWGAMLRLAIVTRRSRDWALLVLVFALNVGLGVFIQATPADPEKGTAAQALIGMSWLIAVVAGVTSYYLYTDIRHFGPDGPYGRGGGPHFGRLPAPPAHAAPQYGGYVPPQVTAVPQAPGHGYPPAVPQGPGYGYPPAAPRVPVPQPPLPQPPAPAPTPPPVHAEPDAPQRLDQVRAELDELSDYLRKEGGSR
jgi:hypothetical protein